MELYFIQPKQIIIPQTFIYVMILSFVAFYAVFPSSLNHSPRTAKNAPQRAIRAGDAPRNNYYAQTTKRAQNARNAHCTRSLCIILPLLCILPMKDKPYDQLNSSMRSIGLTASRAMSASTLTSGHSYFRVLYILRRVFNFMNSHSLHEHPTEPSLTSGGTG